MALDAAIRVDVADVEKAALGDARAQVHDGLGVAVGVARPEGEVRSTGDPRVVVDRAPRTRKPRGKRLVLPVVAALARAGRAGVAGVDVEAALLVRLEARELGAEDNAAPGLGLISGIV